jgi:hypothetical protein
VRRLGLTLPDCAGRRAGSSFGYQAGDGSGSNVQVCWPTEHDGTQYLNTTGQSFVVRTVTILNVTAAGGIVQVALYDNDPGGVGGAGPRNLLGVTDTFSVALGNNVFTLAAPVTVADGARVWVAVRASAGLFCDGGMHADDITTYRYKSYSPANPFTDPFGAANSYGRIIPARLSS